MYTYKTETKDNGKGYWNSLIVSIYQYDTKIGEYERNYPSMFNTFYPFQHFNGKWYALYSKHYSSTRVMELPSCEDIGGEDIPSHFCPVDYYVPFGEDTLILPEKSGTFGFISGCIWGDDNLLKLQYLDLSKVTKGVIIREEKWGYWEIPHGYKLKHLIFDEEDGWIIIRTIKKERLF